MRNLVRTGIPERVATEMTGHKPRSVFERYNIVSSGDLAEATKKMNAADIGQSRALSAISHGDGHSLGTISPSDDGSRLLAPR